MEVSAEEVMLELEQEACPTLLEDLAEELVLASEDAEVWPKVLAAGIPALGAWRFPMVVMIAEGQPFRVETITRATMCAWSN